MENNDRMNDLIRAVARPKQKNFEGPVSSIRREDFSSDQEFLHARALEKLQMDSPEYVAAFRSAQIELEQSRTEAVDSAIQSRREELLKNTALNELEEARIAEGAKKNAQLDFANGKIAFDAIPGKTAEYAQRATEKRINELVEAQLFNEALRGGFATSYDDSAEGGEA